MTTNNSAK